MQTIFYSSSREVVFRLLISNDVFATFKLYSVLRFIAFLLKLLMDGCRY